MHRSILSIACGLATATAAEAAFVNPTWTRPTDDIAAGATDTTYQLWDRDNGDFNFASGTANPAGVQHFDGASVAGLTQNNVPGTPAVPGPPASIFITSGGYLYGFSDPLSLTVSVPNYNAGPGTGTSVLVQIDFISSIAQPIVLGSVLLDGTPYTSTSTSATADTFFGGAGFQSVSSFLWTDLPGNAASYTLNLQTFTTSVPPGIESSALTALAIDTSVTAVPEPAAVGVVAVGALLVRRRR